ncbi:MAG TPA: hypothetical protein VF941_16420 [Clostridia bacterium]
MNVTDKEIKCCQPRNEDLLQRDSSESEKYAGVHDSLKITENNITNANKSRERLLGQILDRNNLNNAFKRVKSNKGYVKDGEKIQLKSVVSAAYSASTGIDFNIVKQDQGVEKYVGTFEKKDGL